MLSHRIGRTVALILLLSAFCLAQSQSGQSPALSAAKDKAVKQEPPANREGRIVTIVLPQELTSAAVPDGQGAWVIQINSGGGFAGTATNSVTLTSAGSIFCDEAKSSTNNLLPDQLKELSELVAVIHVARPNDHVEPFRVSLCSDCIGTSLTLSRREARHKIKTYMTSWDTVTKANLPVDFKQLFDAVAKLSPCQR